MDANTMITGALNKFADDLRASFSLAIPGQPEDQLKAPVTALLRVAGAALDLNVGTKTESEVTGLGARPDIGVAVGNLLTGHVELKAPGYGARPDRFKGENRKQWEKFKALPNLIYTDGNEWALFRNGERESPVLRFSGDVTTVGHDAITNENIKAFTALVRTFFQWEPIVPTSPRALADILAPLCRLLRTDVLAAVETESSAMSILAGEWRTYLFPEADDFQFADAYAQTLTYALLLARFEGVTDLRSKAADALDAGHGLLAQVLRVLGQPTARQEIEIPLDLLERSITAVDPAAVSKHGDPWLYFYEDFLAAYDEKLRKNRGVYYTPAQVVSAQVRLTTELLTTRFEKSLGMADDGVAVLDPAAGTGTYLLAALQFSLDLVSKKYGPGAVPSRATKAGENLHGFELLVGPYAVAHLRLSEQILEAGGQLPSDGAHVYLTDTLEAPTEQSGQLILDLIHKRLTEEHKRAREIKAHKRILVCIGNPPYYRQTIDPSEVGVERQGGWVRHGDHGDDGILEDFLAPVASAGKGVHAKNLYNLYVYFWRWAMWKVFDTTSDSGIVSYISASSYLRGPGFVGMREVMRRTFDDLWIIDLEGDNLGARKTENVFAIQNPVAIAVGVRYGPPNQDIPANVWYSRMTGTHEEKLAALADIHSFADVIWLPCFAGWQDPLLPVQSGDYFSWPLLSNILPWQQSGVQFKRTWPIASSPNVLTERWQALLKAPPSQRAGLFHESRDRKVKRPYAVFKSGPENMSRTSKPIFDLDKATPTPPVVRYGFRSLDRQWALLDGRLGDFLRPSLWAVHSEKQVYLTSLLTGVLGLGPAAMVTAHAPDLHHFRGSYGGKDAIPLWRNAEATEPNITSGLLDTLADRLKCKVSPEQLFSYTYAVMSAPTYVKRFSEELTIPGPRIPITTDPIKFDAIVELGSDLIWLHTFGERSLLKSRPGGIAPGVGRCVTAVPESAEIYPDTVSFNPDTETLHVGLGAFAPVKQEVWDFSISGFEPVKSWIAYRLAGGAGRHSSALGEIGAKTWTADMTEELLRVLWIVEATLNMAGQLDQSLSEILDGEILHADDLPSPTDGERLAPRGAEEAQEVQASLDDLS